MKGPRHATLAAVLRAALDDLEACGRSPGVRIRMGVWVARSHDGRKYVVGLGGAHMLRSYGCRLLPGQEASPSVLDVEPGQVYALESLLDLAQGDVRAAYHTFHRTQARHDGSEDGLTALDRPVADPEALPARWRREMEALVADLARAGL